MAASSDDLERLVESYFERVSNGEVVDLDELSDGDPATRRALDELLDLARTLPGLHGGSVATDPLIGRVLAGRYRLTARIGQGAMGAVYRATDTDLGRSVAVKVLQRGLIERPESRARFLREAEACAKLDHPHTVRVFDRGETEDGSLYLVLELLQGRSLADRVSGQSDGALVERSGEAFRRALELCAEIASGLSAAHRAGIVHRDVKPSNLFEEAGTGRAVLLDFGIAGAVAGVAGSTAADLTVSGSTIGTPWYMPPEVASGHEGATQDPRVDVYGLGATLYHLLAGHPPYEGSGFDVIAKVQREDPPPLRSFGASRDVDAVVQKAMERRPADRYATMVEFEADLRALLTHRPVTARPVSAVGRVLRYVRRQPVLASAAGLAIAVAVFASLSFGLWFERKARSEDDEFIALSRGLPALLSIEGHPSQRFLVPSEERERQREVLDRMVQLRPEDAAVRALRAAVASDAGDPDLARSDWAHLAAAGDPYLLWVASQLDPATAGLSDSGLPTESAPEPNSEAGYFVLAFHRLRSRVPERFESALEALECAGGMPFVEDLRLLLLLGAGQPLAALEAAQQLEVVQGDASARTAFVRGAALCALRRYDEAIGPLRDAVRLRPDRHGPNHNLGVALLRTRQFDEARTMLERAHAIRPWLWNTLAELCQLETAVCDFERAREWGSQIPEDAVGVPAGRRSYELANVWLREAFLARQRGDSSRCRNATSEARALFAEVVATPDAGGLVSRARKSLGLCSGLLGESLERHRTQQLVDLVRAPLDPTLLFNLAEMLDGSPIDAIDRDLLRLLLLEQSSSLVPGSAEHRLAAEALRTSVFERLRSR